MTPTKQRLPGEWLLRIARDLFDASIVTGVIEPTVADLQQEFMDARSSADRALARWRGYFAFWSIVIMAPITLRQWPGHRRRARAYLRWISVIGVVSILAVAWQPIMNGGVQWIWQSLPEGTLGAFGTARSVAFLAGPLAIAVLAVPRWNAGQTRFHVGAAEATMFAMLSVTVAAAMGTASLIDVFSGIGRAGSAGLAPVTRAIVGFNQPMFLAVVTLGFCALVIAGSASWSRTRDSSPRAAALAPMSTPAAVGLSALLGLTILAVDQLLRLQGFVMSWFLRIIDPVRMAAAGAGRAAQADSESMLVLFLWSAILTLSVIAAAYYTWRASRARTTHPLLAWTSRVALVVVLAGATWHAVAVNANLNEFHQLVEAAKSRPDLR